MMLLLVIAKERGRTVISLLVILRPLSAGQTSSIVGSFPHPQPLKKQLLRIRGTQEQGADMGRAKISKTTTSPCTSGKAFYLCKELLKKPLFPIYLLLF